MTVNLRETITPGTTSPTLLACTQPLFILLFVLFKLPHLNPLGLAVNKSLAVFIFYQARSTDFKRKTRGSVNRLLHSLRTVCGSFNVSKNFAWTSCCVRGITVFRPYENTLRRLESLTVCRWYSITKAADLSSVIFTFGSGRLEGIWMTRGLLLGRSTGFRTTVSRIEESVAERSSRPWD